MCHYVVWYIGTNISAYSSTPKMEPASCTRHHIPEGCALQHKYVSHHMYPTSNTLTGYLIMLGCHNEVIMDWGMELENKNSYNLWVRTLLQKQSIVQPRRWKEIIEVEGDVRYKGGNTRQLDCLITFEEYKMKDI